MPSLRKCLRQPHPWLALYGLFLGVVVADVGGYSKGHYALDLYVSAVRGYQHHVSGPFLSKYVACRYEPTCSEYSILAVQKLGLLPGLAASYRRMRSCTPEIPTGTWDVP